VNLFSVDQVNVRLFWESSLQITEGVAQLLSKWISKRLGKKLVLSKLIEDFNSFFQGSSAKNPDQIRSIILSDQIRSTPNFDQKTPFFPNSKLSYL